MTGPDPAGEALATVRRYESAARTIADDESLSVRARCVALLELSRRGRREEAPGLIESGIWRGARAFLEGDDHVCGSTCDGATSVGTAPLTASA